MILKFRGYRLAGNWLCEVCQISRATLQISPLNENPRACPKCGGEMVFLPENPPVGDDDAKELFRDLRKLVRPASKPDMRPILTADFLLERMPSLHGHGDGI